MIDPLSIIIILQGVLVLMGAILIALATTISGQLARLLQGVVSPADAATLQSSLQSISDTLTQAGSPPIP